MSTDVWVSDLLPNIYSKASHYVLYLQREHSLTELLLLLSLFPISLSLSLMAINRHVHLVSLLPLSYML